MWKRCALLFLLFSLSACADFQMASQNGNTAAPAPKGEGLLKQQIVNAQEQNARMEVRVSKFEAGISSLKNEMRGLQAQRIRMEEKIDKLDQKMEALSASIASSAVTRTHRSPLVARNPQTSHPAQKHAKQASIHSPSSPSTASSTAIVPKAPLQFEKTSLSPREAYNQAYRSVREKRNKEAIIQFELFLRRHPKNRLAANAQYWLGESYYDLRDFSTSLKEFQKVIIHYPASRKVPDALYKKGLAFTHLKDSRSAAVEFETLIQKYPRHPLAARARRRLQALGQRRSASR